MRIFLRLLRRSLAIIVVGGSLGAAGMLAAYWLFSPRLPDVATLRHVEMQVPLRITSADGQLMAIFGTTRRIPITIDKIPNNLKFAVLAAEDAGFYHHSGIDLTSIARAVIEVILAGGRKVQGGSTITQQVARRFFLSPQKTYTRKITEVFTAMRMEKELTKDQILELYLNKMFFGHRSYGVAAAARYYYGKTVDQLTLAECAMLASSLQRPSVVNPIDGRKSALARRNWVLGQMLSKGFIDKAAHDKAIAVPVHGSSHEAPITVHADYVAEMVRQKAIDLLGKQALTGGYLIRTTIDPADQAAARKAVHQGLERYDRRHGYRGAEAHVALPPDAASTIIEKILASRKPVADMTSAVVISSNATQAVVVMADGKHATLDLASVAWARRYISPDRRGPVPTAVNHVVKRGDVIRVQQSDNGHWLLAQVPAAQAALVSLDPDSGALRALVGGFDFGISKYNRALMPDSGRQPGSSFKPFIYSAAMDHGFTPASIINDAPVSYPDPSSPDGKWTPTNDDHTFSGPTRLRKALYESKNLVSVRLLDAIGLEYARHYATRFGFGLDQLPDNLSLALGTASVSPLQMARGYAVFANGGYLVTPYVISSITDRDGNVVYRAAPFRACADCEQRLLQDASRVDKHPPADTNVLQPAKADEASTPSASPNLRLAPRVIDPRTAYIMYSMMHDVIRKGTGRQAKKLGRKDLAGKTGSTNDYHDAWFAGFDARLAAAVWVGFDDFATLGRGEFGSRVALPIWMDFMGPALADTPEATLPRPPGVVTLTIDKHSGLPAPHGDHDTMKEIFKVEDIARLKRQARVHRQEADQRSTLDIF